MKKVLGIAVLCVTVSGCSTYAIPRYSADAETVASIRSFGEVKVGVGKFDSGPGDTSKAGAISCRGVGPIKTPEGEPYSEYVRKALINELIIANAYNATAPVTLTGTLNKLNFSSNSGNWYVGLTLASSNGKKLSVDETYKYTTSFYGETACNQSAQAGLAAIQEVINKAVRNPSFPTLLR